MSYPPQPPPAPQYGAPQPRPQHPQAVLALVLGIVSLVFCGLIGPFAWSIGGKAVREIDASGGALDGRSLAQAGKICGIIATALLGVALLVLIVFVLGAAVSMGSALT